METTTRRILENRRNRLRDALDGERGLRARFEEEEKAASATRREIAECEAQIADIEKDLG